MSALEQRAEINQKISEYSTKGYCCSQMMLLLSHILRDIEDEHTIKAMAGLGGGMHLQYNCGALTGGACLLASYGAAGENDTEPRFDYKTAIKSLGEWFKNEYGSVDCKDIIGENTPEKAKKCPLIIEGTFEKCLEILKEYNIDPTVF